MAGAALSQGQVQISWQAQRFRKVKYRFPGSRSSTFARSSADFVAGAALSQGQVQIDRSIGRSNGKRKGSTERYRKKERKKKERIQ